MSYIHRPDFVRHLMDEAEQTDSDEYRYALLVVASRIELNRTGAALNDLLGDENYPSDAITDNL